MRAEGHADLKLPVMATAGPSGPESSPQNVTWRKAASLGSDPHSFFKCRLMEVSEHPSALQMRVGKLSA